MLTATPRTLPTANESAEKKERKPKGTFQVQCLSLWGRVKKKTMHCSPCSSQAQKPPQNVTRCAHLKRTRHVFFPFAARTTSFRLHFSGDLSPVRVWGCSSCGIARGCCGAFLVQWTWLLVRPLTNDEMLGVGRISSSKSCSRWPFSGSKWLVVAFVAYLGMEWPGALFFCCLLCLSHTMLATRALTVRKRYPTSTAVFVLPMLLLLLVLRSHAERWPGPARCPV